MKKICIVLLLILALTCSVVGCGTSSDDDKLTIVTTIYPIYDWVNEVIGDETQDTEITLLLDNGTDMHSFQPSTAQIVEIYNADLFIYVGGESDEWVDDILENNTNDSLVVINLFDLLEESLLDEEIIEGMEGYGDDDCCDDEDHDHDDEDDDCCDDEDHDHDHEDGESDEHVWLSLTNAKTCCTAIASALSKINEDSKTAYEANATAYNALLTDLDSQYESAVEAGSKDTILFADRFPFRYMVQDYDINYYAAFVGCSSETEASTETVAYLVDKVVELKLDVILIIDGSDGSIAQTVKSDATKVDSTRADIEILTINSLQSVSLSAIDDDFSYLSVMKSNLEVLKKALA